jgi:hypothetical protein
MHPTDSRRSPSPHFGQPVAVTALIAPAPTLRKPVKGRRSLAAAVAGGSSGREGDPQAGADPNAQQQAASAPSTKRHEGQPLLPTCYRAWRRSVIAER